MSKAVNRSQNLLVEGETGRHPYAMTYLGDEYVRLSSIEDFSILEGRGFQLVRDDYIVACGLLSRRPEFPESSVDGWIDNPASYVRTAWNSGGLWVSREKVRFAKNVNLTELLKDYPNANFSLLAGHYVAINHYDRLFAHVKLVADGRCKHGVNALIDGSPTKILSKVAFHKALMDKEGFSVTALSVNLNLIDSLKSSLTAQ